MSLTYALDNFYSALSLESLSSSPSTRYRNGIPPASFPLNASMSNHENIMLNRVGARSQPCLTPLVTGKGSDSSPLSRTLAIISSWNCLAMETKLSKLLHILHRPTLLTMLNALVGSTKVMSKSLSCTWHFCWSCLAANIMSSVLRIARKPR